MRFSSLFPISSSSSIASRIHTSLLHSRPPFLGFGFCVIIITPLPDFFLLLHKNQNPYVLRLAFSAGIGGLLFGYDTGVISGAQVKSKVSIKAEFKRPTTDSLQVSLDGALRSKIDSQGANVMVALYECGLVTDCPSGENKGRVLSSDYVVRKLEKLCTVKDISAKKTVSGTVNFSVGRFQRRQMWCCCFCSRQLPSNTWFSNL